VSSYYLFGCNASVPLPVFLRVILVNMTMSVFMIFPNRLRSICARSAPSRCVRGPTSASPSPCEDNSLGFSRAFLNFSTSLPGRGGTALRQLSYHHDGLTVCELPASMFKLRKTSCFQLQATESATVTLEQGSLWQSGSKPLGLETEPASLLRSRSF
jgi:hypothetical protein